MPKKLWNDGSRYGYLEQSADLECVCGERLFVPMGRTVTCLGCGRWYRIEMAVWQYEQEEYEIVNKALWEDA